MIEKKVVVDRMMINYSGLFEVSEFYKAVENWKDHHGREKEIKKKYEEVTPSGKNIEWSVELWRFETEHDKLMTRVKAFFKNVREITIEKAGAKRKMNQGDVVIVLDAFLETDYQPKMIVLLIQKEVAKRIVAQDGKESILSISIKAYGTPKYIETVKAGSFTPAPKVDSAIIAIENISKEFFSLGQSRALTISSEKDFFRMVRAGFKSKRKKLSSNLATIFAKAKILETFRKLDLDSNLRAEDVDLDTWKKLAAHLLGGSASK